MKPRILIIEDEASIRRVMAMALEAHHEVAAAADGPLGLARFGDGHHWDLVLLDQRMPVMEGLDVLHRIKAINPAVPVIMVTAYPSVALAVDAMKMGARDFLRKPVTPDILRAAVAAALAGRPVAADRATPAAAGRRDVEAIALNGFRIVHEHSDPAEGRHRFRVFQGGADRATPVEVVISPAAKEQLERLAGRVFGHASPHWLALAEDYLAAFLWNDQHIPDRPLVLKDVTEDDLQAAGFRPAGM